MPLELYRLWHQYPWQLGYFACVLRAVALEVTACASILTVVAFSAEQHAIVCPGRWLNNATRDTTVHTRRAVQRMYSSVARFARRCHPLRVLHQAQLHRCLYYVQCAVNPVLYGVLSKRFRVAFRDRPCASRAHLCCWRWWREKVFRTTTTTSPSSPLHR